MKKISVTDTYMEEQVKDNGCGTLSNRMGCDALPGVGSPFSTTGFEAAFTNLPTKPGPRGSPSSLKAREAEKTLNIV